MNGQHMTETAVSAVRRRTFLLGSAAAAGAVVLAACGSGKSSTNGSGAGTAAGGGATGKGSSKTALAKPATFQESPLLKAQADAGTIPKLADRLPEEPYVVPHNWVQRGKYGGDLKMNIVGTSGGDAAPVGELFYSFGMLRFANDGQDVAPGVVTKWTSNADASEWSFTLRRGLKWSDGTPVTTADVLFWWTYMANDADYTPESVPDEGKSGKGTICKLVASDDLTFTMTFDAPAPLTADRLAMWTNGPGGNGPTWIVPAHYAKQFHPHFNKNAPKTWASTGGSWAQNVSYKQSPKCPTLTPFKLTKYNDGRSLTWERNPYAYEVTKDGDQLPYIDGITMTAVQDPQVGKVQITAGKVDYSHGPFNALTLADVSTLMKNKAKAGLDVYLWDSGTGAAGIFFLSQDYYDPAYRKLFKEPKFRQGLSLAFNRATAKKAVYFETGDPTTGTMSPKAMEWLVNDEGKKTYESWRDSFVKYDPTAAKKLFDEIGLKDVDGDGFREMPDGKKLTLRIDYPADTNDEYKSVDALKIQDWKAVGINVKQNPVPPTSFDQNWKAGKYMCHSSWEVGDGPNCLLYPQWMVPLEYSRWAPLQGEMYNSKGTKAYTSEANVDPWKRHPPRIMPDKGGPIAKLWDLYDQTKVEPDITKRTSLVWEMTKVHVDQGPFFQGTVANPPQVIVKRTDLKNVPAKENLALGGFVNPWIHPTPAVYDIETYFWDNPDQHKV
jgi:peptide/nickel transport system substrate-binding protein